MRDLETQEYLQEEHWEKAAEWSSFSNTGANAWDAKMLTLLFNSHKDTLEIKTLENKNNKIFHV